MLEDWLLYCKSKRNIRSILLRLNHITILDKKNVLCTLTVQKFYTSRNNGGYIEGFLKAVDIYYVYIHNIHNVYIHNIYIYIMRTLYYVYIHNILPVSHHAEIWM